MKTHSTLQRFCRCALLVCLLMPVAVMGQNRIYGIGKPSIFPIVREHLAGRYVSYNREDSTRHQFMYSDKNSGQTWVAELIIPTEWGFKVNDMEIDGDDAFVCGSLMNTAIVGHFDIVHFFDGSSSIDICYINASTNYPYSARRMELAKVGGGYCVMMLGDAITQPSYGNIYTNQFIIVHYSTTTNQFLHYEYFNDVGGTFRMDDIAIADRMVVIAGHRKDGGAEYITTVGNPSGIYDFIIPNDLHIHRTSWSKVAPDTTVLVVHLGGDTIATLHHCIYPDTAHVGLSVNIYNPSIAPIYREMTPEENVGTALWRLVDAVYLPDTHTICLLQDITLPHMDSQLRSYLYRLDMSSVPPVYIEKLLLPETQKYTSLSKSHDGLAAVMAGMSAFLPILRIQHNNGCIPFYGAIHTKTVYGNMPVFDLQPVVERDLTLTPFSFPQTIYLTSFHTICD